MPLSTQQIDLTEYKSGGSVILQPRSYNELYQEVPKKYGTGNKTVLRQGVERTTVLYGDAAQRKATWPAYWEYLDRKIKAGEPFFNTAGLTADAVLAKATDLVATMTDASYSNLTPYSRINLFLPAGVYFCNQIIPLTMGRILGAGPGDNYGNGGTMLVLSGKDKWIGDPARRDVFNSWNWKRDANGWSFSDWHHYTLLEGIRFVGDGGDWYDPSYTSTGVRMGETGECFMMKQCYFENFNDEGAIMVGGTPFLAEACSAFKNNKGGFGLYGGALNEYTLIGCSGDCQPALVNLRAYQDSVQGARPGGATLTLVGPKVEAYSDAEGKASFDKPGKHQVIVDAEGYFSINQSGGRYGSHGFVQNAVYRLNANFRSTPAAAFNSGSLDVSGFDGFGFKHLVQDCINNKYFAWDQNWGSLMHSFEWSSLGGGQLICPMYERVKGQQSPSVPGSPVRLNGLDGDANSNNPAAGTNWNLVAGTPAYDKLTGPVTAPPASGPLPTITSFSVTPLTVNAGSEVMVSWVTKDTVSVVVNVDGTSNYPGNATGNNMPIKLDTVGNHVIRLTASNAQGFVFQDVTVTAVAPPAPVTSGPVDPAIMGVVYNSDQPGSSSRATAYAALWSIPTINIVGVSLGMGADCTVAQLDAARTKIAANLPAAVKYLALVFDTPWRVNEVMAINAAITWGYVATVADADMNPTSKAFRTNPLFAKDWKTLPSGYRPSMIVLTGINGKGQHGKWPAGRAALVLTNDTLRTQDRAQKIIQSRANIVDTVEYFKDNRGGTNWGENFVNGAANPLLLYITGIHDVQDIGSNTYVSGALCVSYVTSYGGVLNKLVGTSPSGQMPISDFVPKGLIGAEGTVREPWKNGYANGGLHQQFIDPVEFAKAYFGGASMIQAYYASIEAYGLTLIVGDPMAAPFHGSAPPVTPPVTPPTGTDKAVYDFSGQPNNNDLAVITGRAGDVQPSRYQAGWNGKIISGKFVADQYVTRYVFPAGFTARKITLLDVTFQSIDWTFLNDKLRFDASGNLMLGTTKVLTGIVTGQLYAKLEIDMGAALALATFIGGPSTTANNATRMTVRQVSFA